MGSKHLNRVVFCLFFLDRKNFFKKNVRIFIFFVSLQILKNNFGLRTKTIVNK